VQRGCNIAVHLQVAALHRVLNNHAHAASVGETKHSSRLVDQPLSAPNRTKKGAKSGKVEGETGLEPATFSLEGRSGYALWHPSWRAEHIVSSYRVVIWVRSGFGNHEHHDCAIWAAVVAPYADMASTRTRSRYRSWG
jgi:hypothetical protein